MSAQPQPESRSGQRPAPQHEADSASQSQFPGVWLPFLLFVAGFVVLVAESKYTLPATTDYALKGLGGGLCLVAVVWIRRQARKAGALRRRRPK